MANQQQREAEKEAKIKRAAKQFDCSNDLAWFILEMQREIASLKDRVFELEGSGCMDDTSESEIR